MASKGSKSVLWRVMLSHKVCLASCSDELLKVRIPEARVLSEVQRARYLVVFVYEQVNRIFSRSGKFRTEIVSFTWYPLLSLSQYL